MSSGEAGRLNFDAKELPILVGDVYLMGIHEHRLVTTARLLSYRELIRVLESSGYKGYFRMSARARNLFRKVVLYAPRYLDSL